MRFLEHSVGRIGKDGRNERIIESSAWARRPLQTFSLFIHLFPEYTVVGLQCAVEVMGQLERVGSLLLLCKPQRLNSGHQVSDFTNQGILPGQGGHVKPVKDFWKYAVLKSWIKINLSLTS